MNNDNEYILFELCDGTLIGFNRRNVDKLYNCFGCYIRNEEGELEEINSDSESDYFYESDIEDGQVLYEDGTPLKVQAFTEVDIIYKTQVGGHTDWFEYSSINDVITVLRQECKNVWVDKNGESYVDISTPLDYVFILKKESEMTDEECEKCE